MKPLIAILVLILAACGTQPKAPDAVTQAADQPAPTDAGEPSTIDPVPVCIALYKEYCDRCYAAFSPICQQRVADGGYCAKQMMVHPDLLGACQAAIEEQSCSIKQIPQQCRDALAP